MLCSKFQVVHQPLGKILSLQYLQQILYSLLKGSQSLCIRNTTDLIKGDMDTSDTATVRTSSTSKASWRQVLYSSFPIKTQRWPRLKTIKTFTSELRWELSNQCIINRLSQSS